MLDNGISIAYINPSDPAALRALGDTKDAQGHRAIDIVCIFAANLNVEPKEGAVRLAPLIDVPQGGTLACGNLNIQAALQSDAITYLHSKGIKVLLTFLNNWDNTGWSEFSSETDAENFVLQLQNIVTNYDLDGIDIDDEYTMGIANNQSLAMVTTMMRKLMPNIIISKALFQDEQYFNISYTYQGYTGSLEKNLTYGACMAYGTPPQDTLPQYLTLGMTKKALLMGYNSDSPSNKDEVSWLKTEGYAGVMVYNCVPDGNLPLIIKLVNDWNDSIHLETKPKLKSTEVFFQPNPISPSDESSSWQCTLQ